MPHVQLSLQSGDALTLKRMKRRHTPGQAVALVERLKAARPELAIGADLIAGFPTETDDMHRENVAALDRCDVVFAHVFPYSPREGTPAARMPQIPSDVARARAAELRLLASARRDLWLATLVGSTQNVLVERSGTRGHAENFASVELDVPCTPGAIVAAHVTGMNHGSLKASPR